MNDNFMEKKMIQVNCLARIGALLAILYVSAAMSTEPVPRALGEEGRALRSKIQTAFETQQRKDAQRETDLTAECKSLNLIDRKVSHVNKILVFAGQKFDEMIPFKGTTAGPNDFIGGIVLKEYIGYSAIFQIVVRVSPLAKGNDRRVDDVLLCNVLTTSL